MVYDAISGYSLRTELIAWWYGEKTYSRIDVSIEGFCSKPYMVKCSEAGIWALTQRQHTGLQGTCSDCFSSLLHSHRGFPLLPCLRYLLMFYRFTLLYTFTIALVWQEEIFLCSFRFNSLI